MRGRGCQFMFRAGGVSVEMGGTTLSSYTNPANLTPWTPGPVTPTRTRRPISSIASGTGACLVRHAGAGEARRPVRRGSTPVARVRRSGWALAYKPRVQLTASTTLRNSMIKPVACVLDDPTVVDGDRWVNQIAALQRRAGVPRSFPRRRRRVCRNRRRRRPRSPQFSWFRLRTVRATPRRGRLACARHRRSASFCGRSCGSTFAPRRCRRPPFAPR